MNVLNRFGHDSRTKQLDVIFAVHVTTLENETFSIRVFRQANRTLNVMTLRVIARRVRVTVELFANTTGFHHPRDQATKIKADLEQRKLVAEPPTPVPLEPSHGSESINIWTWPSADVDSFAKTMLLAKCRHCKAVSSILSKC